MRKRKDREKKDSDGGCVRWYDSFRKFLKKRCGSIGKDMTAKGEKVWIYLNI